MRDAVPTPGSMLERLATAPHRMATEKGSPVGFEGAER